MTEPKEIKSSFPSIYLDFALHELSLTCPQIEKQSNAVNICPSPGVEIYCRGWHALSFSNLFDCVSVDEVRADEEKLIHQLYKVLQSSVVHDVKPSGVLSVDVTTLRGVKIMKILHLCKLHELWAVDLDSCKKQCLDSQLNQFF